METFKRTALVVGASGLVGGHCLQYLIKDDVYSSVTILVRKEIALQHPKLHQHIVNFDRLDENSSLIKADDIFCCLGTTISKAGSKANFKKVDLEYPLKAAQIALANGANQYLLVTAMGANKWSLIFYNRVKGEVEDALKKPGYQAVHIFRPSLLLGERKETRVGEKLGTILFNATSPLFLGPLKKFRAIQAKAVAGAMVVCAKRNSKGVFVYESNEIQKIFDKEKI